MRNRRIGGSADRLRPGRRRPGAAGWVTTSGVRFIDTRSGNPVILRGVDVGAGSNATLQAQVVALGANFVRLHVCSWQLEPTAPSGSTHNCEPVAARLDGHADRLVPGFTT